MADLKTSALLLRAYDFGEADRVLIFFTRAAGKVRAVARGVRRQGSRLAAGLSLFSLAEVQFHGRPQQELWLVTQVQPVRAFPKLKSKLEALAQVGRMAELAEQMTADRHPMPELFDRLIFGLQLLEAGLGLGLVGLWFEAGLLEMLGYWPDLAACMHCGRMHGHMVYCVEQGRLACPDCGPAAGLGISAGARALLRRLPGMGAGRVSRLRLHPGVEHEAAAVLEASFRWQLGHGLKSDVFRQAVRKLGSTVKIFS